jgi:hypothetical protein
MPRMPEIEYLAYLFNRQLSCSLHNFDVLKYVNRLNESSNAG